MEILKRAQRGVVLIWALITMAVTTTILGAIGSYYATSMRVGRQYLEKNEQYYAFLSTESQYRDLIRNEVEKYLADIKQGPAVSTGGGAMTITKLAEGLRGLVSKSITDGKYRIDFEMKGLENLERDVGKDDGATVTLTATMYDISGGGEVHLMSFEEDLIFKADVSGERVTDPIFDYVYFANNRGHLESPYKAKIIANGNVGANDKFTISGSTVNGYVWAHGTSENDTSAVTLENSPHIWTYDLYMRRVANEYKYDSGREFYTPVRPTNPIYHGNQQTEWPGGFEPPGSISDFGTIAIDGTLTLTSYPKDNEEPKLGDDVVEVDPPGEKPKAIAMPSTTDSQYSKTTGTGWSRKTEFQYKDYYDDLVSWCGLSGVTATPPNWDNDTYWNKDWWGKRTTFKESTYKQAVTSWVNNKHIDTAGKVDPDKLQEWEDNDAAFTKYSTATNEYWTKWNAWNGEKSAWLAQQEQWKNSYSATDGLVLDRSTVHQYPGTGILKYIVTSSTNVVTMPNVSDVDEYRSYCTDYKCADGTEGGTLVCANRCKVTTGEVNISCSFTGNDQVKYVYAYKEPNKWGLGGRTRYERGHVFTTKMSSRTFTTTRTLAYVNVTGGYKGECYPFASRPSNQLFNVGDCSDAFYTTGAQAAEFKKAERGSVILIGTANFPIEIKGPVYFDGDVVIRGFVKGQGTIYSGRNIHIIGDITYLNPPSWPHTTQSLTDNTPDEVRQSNATKDMLMLAARGNIIVGDYTTSKWMDSCKSWMKITDSRYRSTSEVCNDYRDDAIGYAGFDRDYTATEASATDENVRIVLGYADTEYDIGKYDDDDGDLYNIYACDLYYYHMIPKVEKLNRTFYQCKLGDDVITGLMQTSNASGATQPWRWSAATILRWLFGMGGYEAVTDQNHNASSYDLTQASNAVKEDANAGDITQIDAILFANHGIFGRVGGTTSKKFKLHGAMICRDEGLLPSFANGSDFKNATSAEAWLNWDMRIKSSSAEGLTGTGAPSQSTASATVTMTETSWRQL